MQEGVHHLGHVGVGWVMKWWGGWDGVGQEGMGWVMKGWGWGGS